MPWKVAGMYEMPSEAFLSILRSIVDKMQMLEAARTLSQAGYTVRRTGILTHKEEWDLYLIWGCTLHPKSPIDISEGEKNVENNSAIIK